MRRLLYGLASIRFQLTIVVLAATLPMMIFVALFANQQRQDQTVELENQVLFSAKTAAMGYDQNVLFTRKVMDVIATLPSLAAGDYAACNRDLDQIRQNYAIYRELSVNDAAGEVLCSSPQFPPDSQMNQKEQAWFQKAIQNQGFTVGSYAISAGSERGNLTFGSLVKAPDGQIKFIIGAGIDIDALNASASELVLPNRAVMIIMDRQGTVILRVPNPQLWVGKTVPDPGLLKLARGSSSGVGQAIGIDSIERVYGFTTLPSDPHAELLLAVGIPVSEAYRNINDNLLRNLIAIGSLALLGIILAWIITERFILRPASILTTTSRRLSAGDLTARTNLGSGYGELYELAQVFDQMADSLQKQEAQLRALNQELEERVNTRTAELKRSHDMLQQFSNHLQNMLEEERKKISREIHDELGQALTSIKMDLRYIGKQITPDQEAINQRIAISLQLIDQTIATMRRISADLRPGILDDLGLTAAVEWLLTNFQNRSGIQVSFDCNPPDLEVPQELHTGLFRIIQEALTNVMRHAQASQVWININQTSESLEVEIRDNGQGFDPQILGQPRSLGLIGIRERAQLIGGEAKIIGNPGHGVQVSVCVPMANVRGER